MKLAVIQFNPIVGDLPGNARLIVQQALDAYAAGARVVMTPELALCGYSPEDLLLRPAFIQACEDAAQQIALDLAHLPDLCLVLGHPASTGAAHSCISSDVWPRRHNVASVICAGKIQACYIKQQLPNYQVFDEQRYFEAGVSPVVFNVQGVHYGLLICEDAWFDQPAEQACQAGAQVLLVLSASPFHVGKQLEREQRMAALAQKLSVPIVYANLLGGQDELVLDGGSFAVDGNGQVAARARQFEAENLALEITPDFQIKGKVCPQLDEQGSVWRALVLGLKDYAGKNGFKEVVLGLSGGMDSALVLAIAVDALGAQNVRTVMMPSPYTADISCEDAREMAHRLNVRYVEMGITETFDAFCSTLYGALTPADLPAGGAADTTEENIQARVRGTLLMAISNKTGALVLATGNKSELATGYCTLYGDMAGGFAVIKDLVKTRVYKLARWRNANDPFGNGKNTIPDRIITRAPSAELRPDQTDQDNLPPYEVLDEIIERYVEKDQSIEEMVAAGLNRADVDKVTRLIQLSEYKRRQGPVGVRLTSRAFGGDWRYPMTSYFRT